MRHGIQLVGIAGGLMMVAGGPATATSCPTTTPAQGAVVAPETAKQSAATTAGLISERIATTVSGSVTAGGPQLGWVGCGATFTEDGEEAQLGAAAGAQPAAAPAAPAKRNAVWVSTSGMRVNKSDYGGAYAGSVLNGVVGYDRRVSRRLVLGMAVGYEGVDIDTKYNAGTLESTSLSFAPYAGLLLTNWLTADATVGYSRVNYDFTRSSRSITGSTTANRWFGATNLTARRKLGRLTGWTALGYLRLGEERAAYLEQNGSSVSASSVNLGQVRWTVGGAYDIALRKVTVTPNLFARLEVDAPASEQVSLGSGLVANDDRTGAVFGGGLDFGFKNGLSLGLGANTTQFRENTRVYGGFLNLRYPF